MFAWILPLVLASDSLAHSPEPADSLPGDTLREVVVRPLQRLPVEEAIDNSLKRHPIPRNLSLSDVLNKVSPGISDYIMHPLAFKARQRERRRKRHQKILEQFDQVRTFDDLLREAYERQMREDSLTQVHRQLRK